MPNRRIAIDDPTREDVRALLATHLSFTRATSPPEDVHALDVDGLTSPDVSFYSLREDDVLLGVGALRELDSRHGEIKSMHTTATARGLGVGRSLLSHLLHTARARGYSRVSLETGTMEEFAPARRLYLAAGFEVCPPFNDYPESPNSVCMTLSLQGKTQARA
ncbi:MAG: GNAT family N-acetyltransferase [Acidimicrobiia bacterium]